MPIIAVGDGEGQWRSKRWGQTILGAGLGRINTSSTGTFLNREGRGRKYNI